MLYLLLRSESESESTAIAVERPLVIGRSATADLRLDDERVSRAHCRLTPGADHLLLEDLGGVNGTLVNGVVSREPVMLHLGDALQVGPYCFLLSDSPTDQRSRHPSQITPANLPRPCLSAAAAPRPGAASFPMSDELISTWSSSLGSVIAGPELAIQVIEGQHPQPRTFRDAVWSEAKSATFLVGSLKAETGRERLLAELHHTLKRQATKARGPSDTLQALNGTLLGSEATASVICAFVDLEFRSLRTASAAHPSTWIIRGSGKPLELSGRPSLPLGQIPTPRYDELSVQLQPDDTVMLCTCDPRLFWGETDPLAFVEPGIQAVADRWRRSAIRDEGESPADAIVLCIGI
jgi:hypothetical protein